MARTDNEIRVTPSLFDRLIDYEPKLSHEAPKSRFESLADLKQSVRRDLEWLLNSRSHTLDIDAGLVEVNKSVAVYGLPDFTSLSVKNHTELKRMTRALETAIRTFEPRFLDLRVTLEPSNYGDKQLKFRIEAKLDVEPTPEHIAFDTIIQTGGSDFKVKEV